MLKQEFRYLFEALMFYTRLPTPGWFDHDPEYLKISRKYLPLIGWVIGGIGVATYGFAQLFFPASVSLLLSMTATIWVTGAFHEDGLSDACDAFGGGWSRERVLIIMKDSRIGAYGAIGVMLCLAIKFTTLYETQRLSTSWMMISLLCGHTLSRFLASTVIQTGNYVQDPATSKSRPIAAGMLTKGEMLFSSLLVVGPLLLFLPAWPLVFAVIPAYLAKWLLALYFNKKIGGYTGDCLGAVQQVTEIVFYLSVLALCGSI